MQMNGFSLKQMGYFSCFRTMFVRHDLGNFIPREREREREGEGGRGGERERKRGGVGGGRIRYSGKDKVLYGEALPWGQTPHPFISYFCRKRHLFSCTF